MNSDELAAAAAEIEAAAATVRQWAAQTGDSDWSAVHRGFAQQLQDRADAVKSWSATAAHWERTRKERPPEMVAEIDDAVAGALTMARMVR